MEDRDAATALVAVVGALGRRMLRIAVWHALSSSEKADAAEALPRTAFGDGPIPCAISGEPA